MSRSPRRRFRLDRTGSRRAVTVILAGVFVAVSGWAGGAGADDPAVAPPTTLAPVVPSSVPGDSTVPSSTLPGGVTSTMLTTPSVTSGPGGFGAPRVDPDAPPEAPMPDPSPQVQVLLGQLDDQHDAKLMDLHTLEVARFQRREAAAAKRVTEARGAVRAAQRVLANAEETLREDALARYMSPAATGLPRMMASQDDRQRTRLILADVTIDEHVADRAAAIDLVARRRATLQRREGEMRGARRATAAARDRAAKAKAEFAEAQRKLAESRGPKGTWSLPIEGQSEFTAAELADWFIQRGHPSRAQAPIGKLAKAYVDEGNVQGIRGDMAFAQSVLETGSFTNPDTIGLNNFAGIGHCDTCASGFAFATPELGVRAQIQLLADYAQRGVKLKEPLVDHRLHGPSGCCQTWGELTHTWATNGNYGAKIMGVYREMLWWLVRERGMTPLVGPR